MTNNFYRVLSIVLCAIWMTFIFYNSSLPGAQSNNISNKVVDKITSQDKSITKSPGVTDNINVFVRKNGHAIEYMILSMLVLYVFVVFGLKIKHSISWVLFICLFYAVTDEFHQLYVPGRESLVGDVLIDLIGTVIGIFIYYMIYIYIRHTRRRLFS